MSTPNPLAAAGAQVEHLLAQYADYLVASTSIDQLKDQQMKLAITLGAQMNVPFTTILRQPPASLQAIRRDIQTAGQRRQRISDEMTFANPLVWMMYKYKAYAGTSQAITDMADFRKHCSQPGYICTKRYQFLNSHLQAQGRNLNDTAAYPNALKLPEVYESAALLAVLNDQAAMAEWKMYEYNLDNGRVAKWENAPAA